MSSDTRSEVALPVLPVVATLSGFDTQAGTEAPALQSEVLELMVQFDLEFEQQMAAAVMLLQISRRAEALAGQGIRGSS